MGAGFMLALTLLGAVRELGGSGTVFAGAANLLGPAMAPLQMRLYPGDGALVLIDGVGVGGVGVVRIRGAKPVGEGFGNDLGGLAIVAT